MLRSCAAPQVGGFGEWDIAGRREVPPTMRGIAEYRTFVRCNPLPHIAIRSGKAERLIVHYPEFVRRSGCKRARRHWGPEGDTL